MESISFGAVAVDVGATAGQNFCQPSRILATPEFNADEGNRAELKANSFLWTMLADFYTKYPSTRARFPSEGLVATPEFLIRPAPPASHSETRYLRMGKLLHC
jgi:hypothetical protein